jgi:hypothetical protein
VVSTEAVAEPKGGFLFSIVVVVHFEIRELSARINGGELMSQALVILNGRRQHARVFGLSFKQ